MNLQRWISIVLVFLFPFQLFAQVIAPFSSHQQGGSEYFVGKELGKPLITVNLISGVAKPGVYHVPTDTDLAQLIAYAGGSTPKADLSDVMIRSPKSPEAQKVTQVNLDQIIRDSSSMPVVTNRDVIHIAQKENMEKTMKWLSLFSGLATVALTLKLISER